MKIFNNILRFSGIKTNNNNLPKEIDDLLTEHMNRNVHKILTKEIIDETSNDNLLQIVFDNLSAKQSDDLSTEYEQITSLNKSKQAIYVIWLLESEVNNGGFNQFYSNSSGEFYALTPDALKLVGAEKFADLVKKANAIFKIENKKITEFQDGTIEGFSKSYENNPLNEMDDIFYELYGKENLEQLQINYIRENKLDFIDQ